jgi:rhamnogalacturonyl hydrolase YesR
MRKLQSLFSWHRLYIPILAITFSGFCSHSTPQIGSDSTSAIDKVRLVADLVLRNGTFQFLDERNGLRYSRPAEAPAGTQLRIESPYNDWRYWNGVLNVAMLRLGQVLHDTSYKNFVVKSIAFDFDNCGYFEDRYRGQDKWSYPFGQKIVMQELDDYGAMGASLIEVYGLEPQTKYREYIDSAAHHIETKQKRLADGTLVRSFPKEWTLWADDLYMSVSFLCRMGELTHDEKYFRDASTQVINFQKYLCNPDKGLMCHCWYSDTKTHGIAFWGRANGWTLLAQIDLLDRLPANFPRRDTLLSLLRRQINGIVRYQDSSGLWHQLLDKPDSYLETSCSATFTFAILRAVNEGYIDSGFAAVARSGWEGVASRIRSDGQIEGVCMGTGVSDDLGYYYNRPTPLNDVHGIGTVLLAGAEVLQLQR